jgi:flavin-dependent dehydrogenase
MTSFDVVVVGLGAHGSSIAAQCAEKGLKVLGLEQFDETHSNGQIIYLIYLINFILSFEQEAVMENQELFELRTLKSLDVSLLF